MKDRFYPLIIKCLKSDETCNSVAEKCVEELATFLHQIGKGYAKPDLFFSIDSGFNNALLLKKIEEKGFIPICVPKDSHCITLDSKLLNIKNLKDIFEEK